MWFLEEEMYGREFHSHQYILQVYVTFINHYRLFVEELLSVLVRTVDIKLE